MPLLVLGGVAPATAREWTNPRHVRLSEERPEAARYRIDDDRLVGDRADDTPWQTFMERRQRVVGFRSQGSDRRVGIGYRLPLVDGLTVVPRVEYRHRSGGVADGAMIGIGTSIPLD